MERRYEMPFGAQLQADGRVRFRLWAPAAQRIDLLIEDGARPQRCAMQARNEGWFELTTDAARAGTRYRYCIDDGPCVPDPASRSNPEDVHGPSEVIDPGAYDWRDGDWRGRPWEEAVLYELHVGTFTPQGTFAAVEQRLDYLCDLGITALELMPVADFPGARNWGYDGVLPFAPDSGYGRPEDLKHLVQAAHAKGLMIFLDVVYNHFGPDGNYLHLYAPQFFTERHHTPWGAAINFDDRGSEVVREFFVHNACYWLQEYHFDGLRLDAVHAILDDSRPDILMMLAERARAALHPSGRHVHLVLENDNNAAHYLARAPENGARWYDAQWNDDIHHVLHVLITGEHDGYYADYQQRPTWHLARCLTEGFAFQGEHSVYRQGAQRGERSAELPAQAFVSFLQNHDQVGNRAFGERLCALASPEALHAAIAVILLAPAPPLLFMGEEFAAAQPFLFFCDFEGELAGAVRDGRRREFEHFDRFSEPAARAGIPDPGDPQTFARSRLDWECLERSPHADWLRRYRALLALRAREIVPRLARLGPGHARAARVAAHGLHVVWTFDDGAELVLLANLGSESLQAPPAAGGRLLYTTGADPTTGDAGAPWSVCWSIVEPARSGA